MTKHESLKNIFFTNIAVIILALYSYYLALILLVILVPFFQDKVSKTYFSLVFIIIISYILSIFIPEADSLQYQIFFESGGEFEEHASLTRTLELSWVYYIKVLSLFISGEHFFLASNLIMIFLMAFLALSLNKKNFLLLLFIILFMGFTNNLNFLVRQYYSTIFIFLALIYFSSFKSKILYIVAIGFHLSALIYLPLFIKSVRDFINNYAWHLVAFSFILSFVVNIDVILYFYNLFDGSGLAERFRYYSNANPEFFKSIYGINFFEKVLFGILILSINYQTLSEKENIFRAFLIFSFTLVLIFSNISVLAERLGFIFVFFLGIFTFILIKKEVYLPILRLKINFLHVLYFYIPIKMLIWGYKNETTHIVKYFDGSILSSGFLGRF